jgi:hypothetical protein
MRVIFLENPCPPAYLRKPFNIGLSRLAPPCPFEIPEDAEARLVKAEQIFRELGAKMQAFAATDRAATRVLRALGMTLDRPEWHL